MKQKRLKDRKTDGQKKGRKTDRQKKRNNMMDRKTERQICKP